MCYKCGIPGHTSPKCFFDTPLSRAESIHLRNLYQRLAPNCESDFLIPRQTQNNQNFPRDQHCSNNNPVTTQSNSVTAKCIKPVQSYRSQGQGHKLARDNYGTSIQNDSHHNSNSDSDNNAEFVDVDLPCNKLSMQLLANNSATRIKKRRVNETDEEAGEAPKTSVTREKRVPIKRVGKKSSKASVPISGLVGKPPPDIQALLMNTNIVIPALHLFQISPKFREETRRLMTVPRKPRKKKITTPIIPIVEDEKELYVGINYSERDAVDTHHALIQTPRQEMTEILQSKGEAFWMKATIWKDGEKTGCALLDSQVKADQGSDLVIINPKLVKKLKLKIHPTKELASHRLEMCVANGDFTKLKSWVKF